MRVIGCLASYNNFIYKLEAYFLKYKKKREREREIFSFLLITVALLKNLYTCVCPSMRVE
jgi:hypothetical protein